MLLSPSQDPLLLDVTVEADNNSSRALSGFGSQGAVRTVKLWFRAAQRLSGQVLEQLSHELPGVSLLYIFREANDPQILPLGARNQVLYGHFQLILFLRHGG